MSTKKIVCIVCIVSCLILLSGCVFTASLISIAHHQQQQYGQDVIKDITEYAE